jgi:hypothetical protein
MRALVDSARADNLARPSSPIYFRNLASRGLTRVSSTRTSAGTPDLMRIPIAVAFAAATIAGLDGCAPAQATSSTQPRPAAPTTRARADTNRPAPGAGASRCLTLIHSQHVTCATVTGDAHFAT